MIVTIRTRLLRDERGFTLIELLMVCAILGILLAVAVPAYLGFKARADKAAATSGVAALAQDAERYSADNYPGAPLAGDPDWNGTDAPAAGTNADAGYSDVWAGHDVISRLAAKYDSALVGTGAVWNPAGWAPSAGLSTASDYCVYVVAGIYYAAKHGPAGAVTTGTALSLGADGTCTAS